MLIAQTGLGIHLAELSAVLDEGCCRLLIDFRVGSLHGNGIGGIEVVGICAVVVGVLSAEREVAFQYGIGEDELRGPEVIAAVGIVLDGALCVCCCATATD